MKRAHYFLLVSLLVGVLQACGGGGGSSASVTPPPADGGGGGGSGSDASNPPPPVNEGGVSAPFALASNAFFWVGDPNQYPGVWFSLPANLFSFVLQEAEQDANGAIVRLGYKVTTFAGGLTPILTEQGELRFGGENSIAHDVSGDATYAMGRWVSGTGEGATSTHYAVYNGLDTHALPPGDDYVCTLQNSTTPTRSDGATGRIVDAAMTLSVDSTGGDRRTHMNGSMTIAFGDDIVSIPLGDNAALVTANNAGSEATLVNTADGGYALMVRASSRDNPGYLVIARLGCAEAPLPPPPSADEGSVSAPFVLTGKTVYNSGTGAGSPVTAFQQSASGAIAGITVNGNEWRTNGNYWVTKEISGDASYAMGRMIRGSFNERGEFISDGGGMRYAIYNIPASFPTSGAYACTLQSSTTPTGSAVTGPAAFVDGGPVTLSFDSAGAHLSGAVAMSIDSETYTFPLPDLITAPAFAGSTPGSVSTVNFTTAQVADASNGNYAVMVYAFDTIFRRVGSARLICSGA